MNKNQSNIIEMETHRGIAWILHWEATEAERGRNCGEGVSLPNQLGGMGSIVISPSGVRAEPRLPTHFWHI